MPVGPYPALEIFDTHRGKWGPVRQLPSLEDIEMAIQSDEGTFWRTPGGELYRGECRAADDRLMRVVWIGRVRG